MSDIFWQVAKATESTLHDSLSQRNVCVLGTRIVTVVLERLGYEAKPLPVRLAVWNQEWTRRMDQNGDPSAQEQQEWASAGGWSIGIGAGYENDRDAPFGRSEHGGYNGHLVCLAERRYLIDATLAQASRPAKGIVLSPLVAEVKDKAFQHGTSNFAGRFQLDSSRPPVTLIYQAVPGDKSYRQAPDWRDPEIQKLVDTVYTLVK